MKAFPHLVKMHKELASKGLVVISVSVDDPDNAKLVDAANQFLKGQNPPFSKLLLNSPFDYWSAKLDFTIPPCYFVFDRSGRWVRFPGDEDGEDYYDRMDKLIIKMLGEK